MVQRQPRGEAEQRARDHLRLSWPPRWVRPKVDPLPEVVDLLSWITLFGSGQLMILIVDLLGLCRP